MQTKKQLLVGLVVKNLGVESMPIFAESKTLFRATCGNLFTPKLIT